MKVLLVSGSPRRGQNSEKAVEFSRKFLEESGVTVNSFLLSSKKVDFCVACDYCKSNSGCAKKDDFLEFSDLAFSSDVILFFSPVYFGNVTGQLKALFDRARVLRKGFQLEGKLGAGIALGHSRNGGCETTLDSIHHWMLIQGMKVIGNLSHYGGTIIDDFSTDEIGRESLLGVLKQLI
ncbi:flavodoxin family protein [Candidatus Woesearchaeota archaeon]|nr:flavodoxin family protein [Candidatus Woesearchaeota archaeon]